MKIAVLARVLVGLVLAGVAAPGQADPQAEMVRGLVSKYKSSMVTLALVIKVTSSEERGEQNTDLEVDGFLLDPSGLVATTNTAIDPVSILGEEAAGRVTSKVVSVRILTADGGDLPAKVVLRDSDRNLAFVRPLQSPATPLPAVDFSKPGVAQVGDPVYIMGRLGKVGNRNTEVKIQRIISVVDKPRTLYVMEPNSFFYLGNVVFNEQGEPLGLSTMRVASSRRRSLDPTDGFLPIVMPAEDVWEVAQQAPLAKDVKDAEPAPKLKAAPTKPAPKPAPPGKKGQPKQ